jgi:four helix bundle protein
MGNVAEGCGRNRVGELIRSLSIAAGSATELESHFTVASDQGYLKDPSASDLKSRVRQIQRMLAGLIRRLEGE